MAGLIVQRHRRAGRFVALELFGSAKAWSPSDSESESEQAHLRGAESEGGPVQRVHRVDPRPAGGNRRARNENAFNKHKNVSNRLQGGSTSEEECEVEVSSLRDAGNEQVGHEGRHHLREGVEAKRTAIMAMRSANKQSWLTSCTFQRTCCGSSNESAQHMTATTHRQNASEELCRPTK